MEYILYALATIGVVTLAGVAAILIMVRDFDNKVLK